MWRRGRRARRGTEVPRRAGAGARPDAITRPGIKQQEEQPHECDQCELVEKQV
jgi:hypothetical protein